MSTNSIRNRPVKWIPIGILAGVVALGALAFMTLRNSKPQTTVATTTQPLTIAEGEAGKVGDLRVTTEALELAKISIAPADQRLVAEKLSVSGNVQAGGDQLVKVTPRVTGKVVRLLAQTGDSVRAGQSLAVLESSDLAQAQAHFRLASSRVSAASKNLARQRQLAGLGQFGKPQIEEARTKSVEADRDIHEAEHHLAEERTKLAEAESERLALSSKVDQAKAEMAVSKAKVDRAEALFLEQLISQQELERIRADYMKALSDVEVALATAAQGRARIEGANARVEAAAGELTLAKRRAQIISETLTREEKVYKGQFNTSREIVQAESELRQAQVEAQGAVDAVRLLGGSPGGGNTFALTSPIAGRVQERSVTLGETIDSEHAAFVVVNLDQVWAELAIAPRDLSTIRTGDAVELTSEAAPGKVFKGTVLTVGTQANEATRAVTIRTTLENASHILKPGAFVRGYLVTDLRRERVTVPLAALQEHTGRPTVYVALETPGAFEVRHVKLGVSGDGWREISEGLRSGERIAASGTFYLKSEALKSSLSDGCCAPTG